MILGSREAAASRDPRPPPVPSSKAMKALGWDPKGLLRDLRVCESQCGFSFGKLWPKHFEMKQAKDDSASKQRGGELWLLVKTQSCFRCPERADWLICYEPRASHCFFVQHVAHQAADGQLLVEKTIGGQHHRTMRSSSIFKPFEMAVWACKRNTKNTVYIYI